VFVCFFLGRETGALNNTRQWQQTTPSSFTSPYVAQGDLGFFKYKKKNYGAFFAAVNTFTKKVFAVPIRNSKAATLIEAIAAMKKVGCCHCQCCQRYPGSFLRIKGFRRINRLLFDGESSLASRHVQEKLRQQFNVEILAEAHFKRTMAERMIREIKLRTAIALDNQGTLPFKQHDQHRCHHFIYLGEALNHWSQVLPQVINSINYFNERSYKSVHQELIDYFTKPTVQVPQSLNKMYRFSKGQEVYIDATPEQRKQLGFKYTLNKGWG